MFGYKTVLKFAYGGVVSSAYELVDFSYDIYQHIDAKGKPQSNVYLGAVNCIFPGVPTKELIDYMTNPYRYKDGSVSVIDNEGRKLQEISFTTGTCVKLRFDYNQAGKGYVSTIFEIAAKGISIDSYSVDNNWVNK
ncbi:MAG: type VI secretion system tube protein TssD [Bacteroidales bacterium]|jgi:hypothetical protein|nr:hypothetical protein [Paludibacteraceae bacterium]MDO4524075.1 type VI secretion system tube protein TssD [Bacteroidales bacterium]